MKYETKEEATKRFVDERYIVGRAEWDTGKCSQCGDLLSEADRYQACMNYLVHGFMYWCHNCVESWVKTLF